MVADPPPDTEAQWAAWREWYAEHRGDPEVSAMRERLGPLLAQGKPPAEDHVDPETR